MPSKHGDETLDSFDLVLAKTGAQGAEAAVHYPLAAYNFQMIFVELTPFIAFRTAHWTDEDLRGLQSHLLANPDAGDVIRGSAGLRKLRWAGSGRGKRGGTRVIYYRYVPGERIYLIYAYLKAEQDDLTPAQIKVLANLMKDIDHG